MPRPGRRRSVVLALFLSGVCGVQLSWPVHAAGALLFSCSPDNDLFRITSASPLEVRQWDKPQSALDAAPRNLVLYATQAPDYATLHFVVNGQAAEATLDSYGKAVQPAPPLRLGVFTPREGKFKLRTEVIGANPQANGVKYFFGLDCVIMERP